MTIERLSRAAGQGRRASIQVLTLLCTATVAACSSKAGGDPARSDGPSSDVPASTAPATPAQSDRVDVASLGYDVGSAKAPVRVVEMSDFGCGYCRKFHLETWPVLRKKFIETGKVRWKFIPFVTGMFEHSDAATKAAECALDQGPDAFEALETRLWQDQRTWKRASNAEEVIRGWAREAGLDLQRFDGCVSQDRPAPKIAESGRLANQLGVRGTPTFFILGYPPLPGALPTDMFEKVLNEVYQKATGQGA